MDVGGVTMLIGVYGKKMKIRENCLNLK